MISGGLMLMVLTVVSAAHADPDNLVPTGSSSDFCDQSYHPPSNGACQTDNAQVFWHMTDSGDQQLEANDRDALKEMLNARYEPTDLDLTYDSTPVFSGGGETDVIYQEGPPPSGLLGYGWCNDQVGTWECDQWYIKIEGGGRYLDWKLTCHETGHGVGLTHGDWAHPTKALDDPVLGCLRSPLDRITTSALGANNKEQINAVY